MGTAMQESRLTYLMQLGGGPAVGLFQMEPNTHDDIWENFLAYNRALTLKISGAFGGQQQCTSERMASDMLYAAVMCRLHYWRRPEPLPGYDDLAAQAAYWKQHYNTPEGHGTCPQYCQVWLAESLPMLWGDGASGLVW